MIAEDVHIWDIMETESTRRTWLAETSDEAELREKLAHVTDRDPVRVYYEGTLDEALSSVEREGVAVLMM